MFLQWRSARDRFVLAQASPVAVTLWEEWLIRWSITCLTIKGQNSVYMAQGVGIRLAIRKNIQKFVPGDQHYLIPFVRLQIDHCSIKQADLADKQGDVVTAVCQRQSGSRIQCWYKCGSAGAGDRLVVGITQLGDFSMGML